MVHWVGSSGDGIISCVNPPGVVGFNNCRTVEKHRRFSSACFIPNMSCFLALFFVARAASINVFRNSFRFAIAIRLISRSLLRAFRCLMLMVSGGTSVKSMPGSSNLMRS